MQHNHVDEKCVCLASLQQRDGGGEGGQTRTHREVNKQDSGREERERGGKTSSRRGAGGGKKMLKQLTRKTGTCFLPAKQVTYANETFLVYDTDAFRSGIIAMLLLPPIVLPMRLAFIRKRVGYLLRQIDACCLPYCCIPTTPPKYPSLLTEVLGC